MMQTIWHLISQLHYIANWLGVATKATTQHDLKKLERDLTEALGPGKLYALYRRESTGGRDWPEIIVMGVFTSRAGAAMYLCDELTGNPEMTEELRADILENQDSVQIEEDETTYMILAVLHGMDPKKEMEDHG